MWFQSAICTLLLSGLVASQDNRQADPNNQWVSSPGRPGPQRTWNNSAVFQVNPVYTNNEPRSLSWIANFTTRIACFQEGNFTDGRSFVIYEGRDESVNWNGSVRDEWLDDGNVFFFAALNASRSGAPLTFFSHYFNVTRALDTTSSAGPSRTGVPPNGETVPSSGSSSNSVAIGAGVGGGIGGAILLAAIGFGILYLRKRPKKTGEATTANSDANDPPLSHNEKYGQHGDHAGQFAPTQYTPTQYGSPLGSPGPAPAYKAPFEMSHSEQEVRHEMDSTTSVRR